MNELINISVDNSETFARAMHQVDNILRTLTPYLDKNNIRRRDIIKERKAKWLIKLRRYLKEKNYFLRYWDISITHYDNKTIDEYGNISWNITQVKQKDFRPIDYDIALHKLAYKEQKLTIQYENIKNFDN